jgi:hypothetical protein
MWYPPGRKMWQAALNRLYLSLGDITVQWAWAANSNQRFCICQSLWVPGQPRWFQNSFCSLLHWFFNLWREKKKNNKGNH